MFKFTYNSTHPSLAILSFGDFSRRRILGVDKQYAMHQIPSSVHPNLQYLSLGHQRLNPNFSLLVLSTMQVENWDHRVVGCLRKVVYPIDSCVSSNPEGERETTRQLVIVMVMDIMFNQSAEDCFTDLFVEM